MAIEVIKERNLSVPGMWPYDKSVIYKPIPTTRFKRRCFKVPTFIMFHEYVCNDRGKGGSHGRDFSLFIKLALVAEKGGF